VWPNTAPDFASEVIGCSGEASAELLADRYARCAEKPFGHRHWQVGGACLRSTPRPCTSWRPFPDNSQRVMRHANILGVANPVACASMTSTALAGK